MASLTLTHTAFNPNRIDPKTDMPMIEYITDMIIIINPKGAMINLDAIKFFIMDLRNLGGLRINHVSFDGWQSKPTTQYLKRHGVTVDYLSVDRENKHYLTYIDL
jgi:hypothetical protein